MIGAADIHPYGCRCEEVCEPWDRAQPSRPSTADLVSMAAVAGIGAGLALCAVIDAITGWHGLACMFGGAA